eukprot:COSAG01_NODE_66731_length_269_cov_0.611765_1_plen_46_part_10
MLSLLVASVATATTLAWGPADGFHGTMDAANNVAMPNAMRSYLTNR